MGVDPQDYEEALREIDDADPRKLALHGAGAAQSAALGFIEAARTGEPLDAMVVEELAQALVIAGACTDDFSRDGQLVAAATKWLGENT